jgi:hypothetical protein
MAVLEQGMNAACVIVDWNGLARQPSERDPSIVLTIRDYDVEACELRLNRALKAREARVVRAVRRKASR